MPQKLFKALAKMGQHDPSSKKKRLDAYGMAPRKKGAVKKYRWS